jgi:hypothetical protein
MKNNTTTTTTLKKERKNKEKRQKLSVPIGIIGLTVYLIILSSMFSQSARKLFES